MNNGEHLSVDLTPASQLSPGDARSRRSKLFRRIGCVILALIPTVVIGVSVSFFIWLAWYLGLLTSHPSDAELIALLHDHKPEFEELMAMFEEDAPIKVVHPTWIDPEGVITLERWDEYRAIFRKLGIDAGMRRYEDTGLKFIVEVKGLVTGGSDKGFEYRPPKPEPLYDSLDEIPADLKSNVGAYRKIDDDWFITFSWDD